MPALLLGLALTATASATDLQPGDIVITGYHSDGADRFSFLTLVPIEAGTELHMTDRGWLAAGGFRDPVAHSEAEGTTTWSPAADLPPGTEVLITVAAQTSSVPALMVGTPLGLVSSGDQVFLYQGSEQDPRVIAGIQMNGPWQADATSHRDSARPPDLAAFDFAPAEEVNNGMYDCASGVAGDADTIRALVLDEDNWILTDDDVAVGPDCSWAIAWCGDGAINGGEICDGDAVDGATCQDGGWTNPGSVTCNATCDGYVFDACVAVCGDGNTEPGEDCDDGGVDTAACDNDCTLPLTADGVCNTAAGQNASTDPDDCPTVCGDGLVTGAELCDGANLDGQTCQDLGYVDPAGLACAAGCLALDDDGCVAVCGNGVAEPGETCDDGPSGSSACTATCRLPGCDDGVCSPGEDAVDCPEDCPAVCGDGAVTHDEACDGADLDGASCATEGYTDPSGAVCASDCATIDTSGCQATCGDGVPEPGEGCDDGATADGDGCSATCAVESGWSCDGAPSVCTADSDGDGVPDTVDNCPDDANPGQEDEDADGVGDACDGFDSDTGVYIRCACDQGSPASGWFALVILPLLRRRRHVPPSA